MIHAVIETLQKGGFENAEKMLRMAESAVLTHIMPIYGGGGAT